MGSYWSKLLCGSAICALLGNSFAPIAAIAAENNSNDGNTTTPIKHVIVIIGENRTFDHVFATYQPNQGETVMNLLSEGIVNADGTPGKNYANAVQQIATDTSADGYAIPRSFYSRITAKLPCPRHF